VRVRLDDGSEHDGVASLGIRPSFDPPVEMLETFIFDWSGDLYGRTIEVALVGFIRPEAKFDELGELVKQMDADSAAARAMLA
jgi:riboflavin kinase/FMN adenylyltransferase